MRSLVLVGALGLGLFLLAPPAMALTPAQRYVGRLVISNEAPNTIWYVDPRTKERVPATSLTEIRTILRERAERIKTIDLKRLPVVGSLAIGDVALRRRLAGRFVVVTDQRNQAWYVTARTKRRARLGSGEAAVRFVASQAIIINAADMARIPTPPNIQLVQGNINTNRGTFRVDRLIFNWTDLGIKIVTDTANARDCGADCPVMPLGAYVQRRQAVAGIHGTYFCPQDYAACAAKRNSYIYPVWNSFTTSWRNGQRIKYTAEPLVAFDTTNRPFLYTRTLAFHSPTDFQNQFMLDSRQAGGSGLLQAALSNGPALIKDGQYILRPDRLDTKQATVKGARGGLGWRGQTMVFFIAHGATVTDLAAVAQALELENAVNLDGGGSTALYHKGHYILGPGRNLPNAILITHR